MTELRMRLMVFCGFLLVFATVSAHGQSPTVSPRELDKDQLAYLQAFDALLQQWAEGQVTFNRGPDSEFEAALTSFKVRQEASFTEAAIPFGFVADNWKRIPEKVSAEIPLSMGARFVLAGGIVDAVPVLKEKGIQPTPEALERELAFPLYLTLGAGQEVAKESGVAQLDAISIRRGGVWFFSLGWPFCCAEPTAQ